MSVLFIAWVTGVKVVPTCQPYPYSENPFPPIAVIAHVNNMTQSNWEMEKPKTVEELINKHRQSALRMTQPPGQRRFPRKRYPQMGGLRTVS